MPNYIPKLSTFASYRADVTALTSYRKLTPIKIEKHDYPLFRCIEILYKSSIVITTKMKCVIIYF